MVFPASKMTGTCFFLHSGSVSFLRSMPKRMGKNIKRGMNHARAIQFFAIKKILRSLHRGVFIGLLRRGNNRLAWNPKRLLPPSYKARISGLSVNPA